jgi:hypothetical protein
VNFTKLTEKFIHIDRNLVIANISFTAVITKIKQKKSCPCALTEHHAMKTYWGSGGIAPCIL